MLKSKLSKSEFTKRLDVLSPAETCYVLYQVFTTVGVEALMQDLDWDNRRTVIEWCDETENGGLSAARIIGWYENYAKIEGRRLDVIATRKRKEELRRQAIAKLTEEECRALGVFKKSPLADDEDDSDDEEETQI